MFSTLILTSRVRVSESTTRGGFTRAERLLWSCRSTQGVKRHVDPVKILRLARRASVLRLTDGCPLRETLKSVDLRMWYYRVRKGQYWSGVHPLPVAAQYAPAL